MSCTSPLTVAWGHDRAHEEHDLTTKIMKYELIRSFNAWTTTVFGYLFLLLWSRILSQKKPNHRVGLGTRWGPQPSAQRRCTWAGWDLRPLQVPATGVHKFKQVCVVIRIINNDF